MATKPYEGVLLKRFFPRGVGSNSVADRPLLGLPYLNEMLLKKQEAIIKKIKPEKNLNDRYEWEFYPEPEGVGGLPHPKLWYLIVVLKKPAFL